MKALKGDDKDEPKDDRTTKVLSTLHIVIFNVTAYPSTAGAVSSPSKFMQPDSTLVTVTLSPQSLQSSFLSLSRSSQSATATVTASGPAPVVPSSDSAAIVEQAPTPAASDPASGDEEVFAVKTENIMNQTMRASVGVGVTLGVVSIAGIAGLYLWRRHRIQRSNNSPVRSNQSNIFGKIFNTKNHKHDKKDSEWSIPHAEEADNVQRTRVQSVSTASLNDSRNSDSQKSDFGDEGTNTFIPPRRILNLPNTALGSHPITPIISSFPTRPVFPTGTRAKERTVKEDEQVNGSWPLSH